MNIKFFKKEKSFKKENLWLDISFFWKLFIFIMFATTLGSLFFGYYFFMKINKESAPGVEDTKNNDHIVRKERIEKVLEYFSLRQQRSDQILISPAPVIDPSL